MWPVTVTPIDGWSPDQYERFRSERQQPFVDLLMLCHPVPGGRVVDLGCGTGDLTARLARHVGRVVAVDRSAAMLKAARRRVEGLQNVELHRADLEELPLDDASCDAALLVLALTYVAEPGRVLAEVARILRPGGAAVVADLVRHDDDAFRRRMGQASLGFDAPELTALLERAGLGEVRCRSLPPEPGARGPALLVARAERAS